MHPNTPSVKSEIEPEPEFSPIVASPTVVVVADVKVVHESSLHPFKQRS